MNRNKRLHQLTVDELEHLSTLNREALDSPESLDEEDWVERSEMQEQYDKVLTDGTAAGLSKAGRVRFALEDHMESFYCDASKERTAIRNDLIAAGHIKVSKRKPAPVVAKRKVSDRFTFDDGGRSLAGYRGHAGDCVCRSICIAAELPYKDVYDRLADGNATQRKTKRCKDNKRSARNGINTTREWFKQYMRSLGFVWVSTMGIGTGCTVHFRREELPSVGRLVVALSGHYSAMIDGVIHDIYDPSRQGKRCVYGYWIKAPDTAKAVEKRRLKDAISKTKLVLQQLESQLASIEN